jgi:hypothetical protein
VRDRDPLAPALRRRGHADAVALGMSESFSDPDQHRDPGADPIAVTVPNRDVVTVSIANAVRDADGLTEPLPLDVPGGRDRDLVSTARRDDSFTESDRNGDPSAEPDTLAGAQLHGHPHSHVELRSGSERFVLFRAGAAW